jgi:transcriptional regulator with XRE-family HTH domain
MWTQIYYQRLNTVVRQQPTCEGARTVAEGGIGSTVRRRQLGRRLRLLRERAKIRAVDAAKATEWSQPTIWRIETGQNGMRARDVKMLCELYGADEKTTAELTALAKETKRPDWWRAYGNAVPPWFELYLGLEELASWIRWYEGHLLPGLLQTPTYTRALMCDEPSGLTENRVTIRLRRQELLTREEPAQFEFLLDESVLHRQVGDPHTMVEQLKRLLEVSELPNVTLRVLPYSIGSHDGLLSGPFMILDLPQDEPDLAEPTMVYLEGFTSATYQEKVSEIAPYLDGFDSLHKKALDEQASRELITQVARSLQ